MRQLSSVDFKNEFVENFEGDDSGSLLPRQTPGKFYSKALPTPVKQVSLLAWSDELAQELEIQKPQEGSPSFQQDVDILGGNYINPTMQPYAACYAGHQFGNWAGQLGDGRAITLGELQTSTGKTFELQLKGGGPTAYSRRADGRAVLRSSIREYLMSEAMYFLGVPTTRALSLVTTGDRVMRDMFYDGNAEFEPGAIVMRVAPTFLRLGNFEMPSSRNEIGNLRKLVNWTIEKYYPHITGANKVLDWYKEVVERTAQLMVEWLRVGFVHGVMNTDNMSILGLSIDYGPYSFVDDYDPNFTPNTTDLPGRRYAFGKQAAVAKWNLGCLGGAIAPLFENTDDLIKVLDGYDNYYWSVFNTMMANKLGLDELRNEDVKLITAVEKALKATKADMTIFYQLLMEIDTEELSKESILSHFEPALYKELTEKESDLLVVFINSYKARIKTNNTSNEQRLEKMSKANPRFILRNYLLHQAIEQVQNGDHSLFIKLQQALKEPYSNKYDEFFAKRPNWATQKAGCSMLSCSS